jgi:ketosteroid isomerase-like protein
MSQENVEIARQAFLALGRGGVDEAVEFLDPEVSWRAVENAPDDVGEMRGIAAMRRYVEDWFDMFDGLKVEPEELIGVGDDQVVAVIHVSGRAKASGIEAELRYASVSTIRAGKVVRVREYSTRDEALKAVGLEE